MSIEEELINLGPDKFRELPLDQKIEWFLKVNADKLETFEMDVLIMQDEYDIHAARALLKYGDYIQKYFQAVLVAERKKGDNG